MTPASNALDAVLWTAAVATLGTVVLFSLGPGAGPTGILGADKLWHALAYGALTGGWLLAAVWRPGRGPGRYPGGAPLIVIGAAVLGALLELLQGGVGRFADPLDWMANLVGIALATVAWLLMRRGVPR